MAPCRTVASAQQRVRRIVPLARAAATRRCERTGHHPDHVERRRSAGPDALAHGLVRRWFGWASAILRPWSKRDASW